MLCSARAYLCVIGASVRGLGHCYRKNLPSFPPSSAARGQERTTQYSRIPSNKNNHDDDDDTNTRKSKNNTNSNAYNRNKKKSASVD